MANPDFLDVLGEEMGRVYEACHDRLLINLARHFMFLKPGEEPGGSFQYQARKLAEMGQVTRESVEIIRGMLKDADPALANSLEAAILDALADIEPELRKAAAAGLLGGEAPPEISPRTMGAFQLYYRQSADKLNLVNTVMLESTENAYRATVSDIVNRMQRAQTIVDTATGEVVSGVESFNQALKQATQQMVENGITGFVDHGGHRWRPETYVAMDMRTTFHNVSRAAFWERNEEYGNDLYLVSQHPGARPLCYPWQCKVISRKDQARDVTDGADQPVHVYAQSETTYGEPAGLFGINCGHHPELFIPGATKVPELRQNEEENARTYAESQKQRKLEREFRKARLDLDVAKAQGDEEGLKQARGRLEKADERLERFVNETGRKRRREREYAPVNAKWPEEAQTAAEKALTDGGGSGTIAMRGDKRMGVVQSPIEQRNTGKGNPNAMTHFDRPLNSRQQRLMDELPEFDSRATVRKQDVNLRDISALTAKTGDEFALFTRRGERMVVRGNDHLTNIDVGMARQMARNGWRWSGHTHPGDGFNVKMPSPGDYAVLKAFGQRYSVILDASGKYAVFGGDLDE